MDLELARADRHLDAVAFAAGACERLRHGRLRRPEEAEDVVLARRARRRARAARARSRARAARVAAARAAGPAGRRRRIARGRGRARVRCLRARARSAPSGTRRLLAHSRGEVARTGARGARRSCARCVPICALELLVDGRAARPATRATSSTVRSSCVGPSPPETRQRSAANASRNACSRSSTASPTIAIDAGSRPRRTASAARNGPFRSWRSPRTSSEPVTTIAARGRLKRWPGRSSAR